MSCDVRNENGEEKLFALDGDTILVTRLLLFNNFHKVKIIVPAFFYRVTSRGFLLIKILSVPDNR